MEIQNGAHRGSRASRRTFMRGLAGLVGAGFWSDQTIEAYQNHVNTNSRPAELKITDLRVATVARAPMTDPIIRIVPTTTARITASITAYSATSWPSSSHNLPKARIMIDLTLMPYAGNSRLTPSEAAQYSDGMIMSSVQCFARQS